MKDWLLNSFFLLGDLPQNIEKGTYIPVLVLIAYIVATFGSFTGLSVAALISGAQGRRKLLLRLTAAFAYGFTFWSMHFIGMLSYKMSLDVAYNPWITAASLLISVLVIYFVVTITRTRESPSPLRIFVGATLQGIGICVMHYIGMEAMQMNATLRFIPSLFILSIVVAILGSWAALWIVLSLVQRKQEHALKLRVIAAFVMAIGICGAYYIGMAASVIESLSAEVAAPTQSPQLLAIAVLAATALLLFILTFIMSNRIFLTVGCGALFALPLVLIIHQAISALNLEIEGMRKEQMGLVAHNEMARLFRKLEDVRDLNYIVGKGAREFEDLLASKKEKIPQLVAQIDSVEFSRLDDGLLDAGWKEIRADLLQNDAQGLTVETRFDRQTRNIMRLLNLMHTLADSTNLTYDPQIGKDHMLDYSVHVIPAIWEYASLLRSQAVTAAHENKAPQDWSENEKFKLKNTLYILEAQDIGLEDTLQRIDTMGKSPYGFLKYNEEIVEPYIQKLMRDVEALGPHTESPPKALDMFALTTAILDSYLPFYEKPSARFLALLKNLEKQKEYARALMLYSSMTAFLGFVALFVFLNRSLLRLERTQELAVKAQKELGIRLGEKERLEHQMQDYTDRLELSRFDVMAANTRLREEETKIRAIMDNMLEGIVTFNEAGTIQMFNKAAENVFGYKADEAISKTFDLLLPPGIGHEASARIKKYVETGEEGLIGIDHEFMGQRRDGSRFPMIATISEVFLGKARLFIAVLRDITQQKEKESELLRITERAEAANKIKSDFLANMSHELRTPLNSVFGMTRLLLGTKLTTEQQELANTVLLSSTNLMEIVNDILDLSKIEAGEVQLEHIGFDPHQILHAVVRSLAHAAREKHVPIVRLFENETLPFVKGDPLRLSRIVTNLLSNAIKYTETGHIEVRAIAKPIDPTHIELRCEVTDTGIGIPANKLDSVFDKFVQADSSTTRKYGGTGLGLAITRELVLMMGGKIGVTSEVGQGSTFWFNIPFEVSQTLHEDKDTRQHKIRKGSIPPATARLLVAEDHPMNQMLIKRLLEKFGIGTIKVVANGNEVLDAYGKESWSIVLMDCHMPEKNGYDATAEIRNLEQQSGTHIPVVAMTANAMVGDREKCIEAGMDEYVSKPINIEELKEVLSQWIAFESDSSKDNTGDSMSEDTPPVDLTMLRTLTGGDVEVEKELMQTFVEQSNKNIETLRGTKDADGENKPWTESAHMLKGGSGSIGAEELRQLCSEAQLYTGDSYGRQALFAKIEKEYGRVKEHLKKIGLIA